MGTRNTYFYREHATTCAPDDYWGQVKRTVNGQPVAQTQIDMIVAAIRQNLDLRESDFLLDLCCGNGALTRLAFGHCAGGVGVDFTDNLIEVAWRNFQHQPHETYVLNDVAGYVHTAEGAERFTKALCYGAFQLLHEDTAREVLHDLRRRFTNLERVFIGNLPDRAVMDKFFYRDVYRPGMELDPNSPTGIWRTEDQFAALCADTGWEVCFHRMPTSFHAAAVRYDAILTPAPTGATT